MYRVDAATWRFLHKPLGRREFFGADENGPVGLTGYDGYDDAPAAARMKGSFLGPIFVVTV